MDINDDMIRRFFDQRCNEEEARLVTGWLKEHPHLADQYYRETDWINETGEQLPASTWDAMWQEVRRRIRRRYLITRMAYGLTACICIMLLYIRLAGTTGHSQEPKTYAQSQVPPDSLILRNEGDTACQQLLTDGTIVSLLPHSTVSLSRTQWNTARAVAVDGEAVFHVAANQERPFIVYCDNFSIQALGTVFGVRKQHSDQEIRVRLYEGKVVVKPVMRNRKKVLRTFTRYLLPGQELVVSLSTYVPVQQYFLQAQQGSNFVKDRQQNKTPHIRPTGWYEFTSQPLEDVFTTLEILYGVQIHYNKATLEKLFFIGRFEPDESIEDVLGTIALLNNLKVTKRSDNNFYVTAKG
jgi:transmembrane sensor